LITFLLHFTSIAFPFLLAFKLGKMVSRHFAASRAERRTIRDDYDFGLKIGSGTYGEVHTASPFRFGKGMVAD
jgi:hypothetical protein